MSVRFNCNGSLLLTLHRRLPPILYSPSSAEPLCSFYHDEYFNSCTMKSCTFAGPQDELIVSGSDNFNMFIWRLDGVDCKSKSLHSLRLDVNPLSFFCSGEEEPVD